VEVDDVVDKKFQIFISSTYTDLKDERSAVIKAVLEMNHIPIGMEMFSAGDDDQWAVISRTIDTSDYYVVIIGHRYGSMTDTGISYTEKEYEYAVGKHIPVLAFIIADNVPVSSERESDAFHNKLAAFKDKAKKKMSKFWSSRDELAAAVTTSLYAAFSTHPRIGWVRAESDILAVTQEVTTLSKENRELRQQLDSIKNREPILLFDLECGNSLIYKFVRPALKYRREYKADDVPEEIIAQWEAKDAKIERNSITLGQILSAQRSKRSNTDSNATNNVVVVENKKTDYHKLLADEITAYNAALPRQSQYDEYNQKLSRYVYLTKNCHKVNIYVANEGSAVANDISVTLSFPPELIVFDDYTIRQAEEPGELEVPIDPVEKIESGQWGTIQLPAGLRQAIEYAQMFTRQPGLNTALLSDAFHQRDYYTDGEDFLRLEVEKLLHTHTYHSDGFYIVATKCGIFEIEGEIICEELSEPIRKTFAVTVE
jgi:hypothetical protein